MKIHRSLNALPSFQNSIITIGTYDGVHLGHQKIIKRINELAKDLKGESAIITFYPHPRIVINNDYKLELITTMEEKSELLRHYGIQHLCIVPFNREFSNMTAEAYIDNFLVHYFQPKKIVIGYNHKFGRDRSGDIDLLRAKSKVLGFEVEEISEHELSNIKISSTDIRKYISRGEIIQANDLLGHSFQISGTVVKGKQLGRALGYPTANLHIAETHKLLPKEGIYAVKVHRAKDIHLGMLYIGYRPTIDGKDRSIEVNIFDFDEDIYGERLKIELVEKIRDDMKLDGLEALKEQIDTDKRDALRILAAHNKQSI